MSVEGYIQVRRQQKAVKFIEALLVAFTFAPRFYMRRPQHTVVLSACYRTAFP